MQGFWKNWLIVWCWGVFVFGVVLALAAVPGADGPARFIASLISDNPAGPNPLDQPAMPFAIGLQGALSIGWALSVLTLVRAAPADAGVWRSLTLAVSIWYVIDSAISLTTGFALNAASNTLLFAAFLAPMLASGALRADRQAASRSPTIA